jgi:hypothetical protein
MAEAHADWRDALTWGELIAAGSAAVLAILMFATRWYGVAGLPGTSSRAEAVSTQNAWSALTVVRWEMLLTIAVALGAVAIHLRGPSRSVIALVRLAVAALGSLTALLLTYRVLIELPSPPQVVDQKLGAVLGVISAYGVAIGGYEAIREQRARSRPVVQTSISSNPVTSGATLGRVGGARDPSRAGGPRRSSNQ